MNQKCKHCQQLIISNKPRKLNYCSRKECQKSRKNLALKKSYLKNRSKRLAYAKKYQKEFWESLKKPTLCEICQKQFNRQLRGNSAKTCSAECSFQLKLKTRKQINDRNYTRCSLKKTNRNGPCCFKAFTHLNSPHCDFCHQLFKRAIPSQKFCSTECRKQKIKQAFKELRTRFKQKRVAYLENQPAKPCIT